MGQCSNKNEPKPNLLKHKVDKSKRGITFGLASMRGKSLFYF